MDASAGAPAPRTWNLTQVAAERARRSLRLFVRRAWHIIEPNAFVSNWHIDAICLPAESRIMTDSGVMPIGTLVNSAWSGKVLSLNHQTGVLEWRQVLRKMRTPMDGLLEIRTESGATLTITGNHPVYVRDRGYVRADDILPGEQVLQLRTVRRGVPQEDRADNVLQPPMLRQSESDAREVHLRLRQAEGMGRGHLHGLSGCAPENQRRGAVRAVQKARLSLKRAVERQFAALRHLLQSRLSRAVHQGIEQSGVPPRPADHQVPAQIQEGAARGAGPRRSSLLSVFGCWSDGCPPHRLEPEAQQTFEPRDAVPDLPRPSAREGWDDAGHLEVFYETVSSVVQSPRVCDALYNLEVDHNNNYFAEGVLVHNCDHLAYVSFGDIRNLMIAMPPRMSKSLVVSVAWPAWDWIDNPDRQFLFASYAHDLALRDATKARRLIESPWYQEQFGYSFFLLADDNQKAKYINDKGGHRISISVQGKTTGEGGNILVGDDFHNVEDMESDVKRQKSVSWHDNAWRSRTNDPNTSQKVYVGQRSHDGDIYGHVLARERERWVELVMPMEYDPSRRCITYANKGFGQIKEKLIFVDPRKEEGELLNPKRFNKSTAKVEKDNMAERKWMAQFQQQPEGAGGYILKRGWWKEWTFPEWHPEAGQTRPLPEFLEIVQVYDTAFEDTEEDDFTARLTFGVFVLDEDFDAKVGGDNRRRISDSKFQKEHTRGPKVCALMLDRFKGRPVFPDLRQEMQDSFDDYEPEKVLIEKKSSGHSLIQEARLAGIPVKAVLVGSDDLQFRASISSLPLEQGRIFYISRNWSLDVIDEAARFPNGDHDDQVSCLVMFLAYLRRFYDLGLAGDVEKNNEYRLFQPTRKKYA